MMTAQLAGELKDSGIVVNAADPGYTKTDLNHNQGTQTVAEGAEAAVRLALLTDGKTTGKFFDRMGEVAW